MTGLPHHEVSALRGIVALLRDAEATINAKPGSESDIRAMAMMDVRHLAVAALAAGRETWESACARTPT